MVIDRTSTQAHILLLKASSNLLRSSPSRLTSRLHLTAVRLRVDVVPTIGPGLLRLFVSRGTGTSTVMVPSVQLLSVHLELG